MNQYTRNQCTSTRLSHSLAKNRDFDDWKGTAHRSSSNHTQRLRFIRMPHVQVWAIAATVMFSSINEYGCCVRKTIIGHRCGSKQASRDRKLPPLHTQSTAGYPAQTKLSEGTNKWERTRDKRLLPALLFLPSSAKLIKTQNNSMLKSQTHSMRKCGKSGGNGKKELKEVFNILAEHRSIFNNAHNAKPTHSFLWNRGRHLIGVCKASITQNNIVTTQIALATAEQCHSHSNTFTTT